MSVRSSTVFLQEGSTKKKSMVLFKDTPTIMDNKHNFYGFVNQLNGRYNYEPLTSQAIKSTNHVSSVFD